MRNVVTFLDSANFPIAQPHNRRLRETMRLSEYTNRLCVPARGISKLTLLRNSRRGIDDCANGVEIDVDVGIRPTNSTSALAQVESSERGKGQLGQRRKLRHTTPIESWFAAPDPELVTLDLGGRDELLLGAREV